MKVLKPNPVPRRELSVFDTTSLIVGIIVGAGIFQVSPDIARGTGTASLFLGIWLVGGLLSLFGALNYAELASAFPRQGGDLVYLNRAYGSWAGFLFGWVQTAVVRPGDIAVMAFIFANYARALYDPFEAFPGWTLRMYAIGAIVLVTLVNLTGVRSGKIAQNLFTIAKTLGILAVVALAVAGGRQSGNASAVFEGLPASLALILVLFTYGGWNEMAYVAAEIRNPGRNIVKTLFVGTTAVTGLYLLVNGAYLWALGFGGLAGSSAVAVDTVRPLLPTAGEQFISALICVSAFGAINGLAFAGARISYALGNEYPMFRKLGGWNETRSTPVPALILQGLLAIVLVMALGGLVDAILYTAPAVYGFYLATTLAVIRLRKTEPRVTRPYRVWGYPWTTLIFAGTCGFLIYSAVIYKPAVALAAVALCLLGLPLYATNRRLRGHVDRS